MPNRFQCAAVSWLMVLLTVGCITDEAARNQVSVFAPVSFLMNEVNFEVEVVSNGISNEIVVSACGKSGIRTVWLHASLIPDRVDCGICDGICEDESHKMIAPSKSYGAASSSFNQQGEVVVVREIPEELSNIRYVDLDIEVSFDSGECFRCGVKVFNMERLIGECLVP